MNRPRASRATEAAAAGRGHGLSARIIGGIIITFLKALRFGDEARALRLARAGCWLLVRAVRPARERNLELMFGAGTISAARRGEVERACLDYASRLHVNLGRLGGETLPGVLARVGVQGRAALEAAQAEQRGVLVLSAHSGTWWHVPPLLVALGHRTAAIVYPGLPGPILSYANSIAHRFGISQAYVGAGAYHTLREAFKQRQVCYVACDVNLRPEHGSWFPFGARGALALDAGPAILALRHRVPVVWANTYHDAAGRSCVEFLPAFHAGRGTEWPDTEAVLRYLARRIEAQTLLRPEQWWPLGFRLIEAAAVLPRST